MDSHGQDDCPRNADGARQARIREINDQFRRDRKGGYACLTSGVAALGYETYREILTAIETFDDFTPDNDPHGEHDFGAVTIGAHRFFWKIDYYDRSETYASPDPTDPSVTTRFLTIMLASEY